MPFAAIWMDLKIVILSEVSHTEKDKYHMTSFLCEILKKKRYKWIYLTPLFCRDPYHCPCSNFHFHIALSVFSWHLSSRLQPHFSNCSLKLFTLKYSANSFSRLTSECLRTVHGTDIVQMLVNEAALVEVPAFVNLKFQRQKVDQRVNWS